MTDVPASADQSGRPLPPARPRSRPSLAAAPAASVHAPSPQCAPDPLPDAPAEYTVGYCKPPKHSQFKPGQSGNPRGRPPHSKGLNTILREQLGETVVVKTPQGPKRMSVTEVIVRRLREKAMNGDMRSIVQFLALARQAFPDAAAPEASDVAGNDDLTAGDQAVLDQIQAIIAAATSPTSVGEQP